MRDANDGAARPVVQARFWPHVWTLLKPYWVSDEKLRARLLLFVIVALTLSSVYMDVLFNHWYSLFYNALQEKDKAEFFHQLWRFCVLAAIYIVIGVYATYLSQMLQVRWRRWLTERYLHNWLADRTYYRMQLISGAADNPDQPSQKTCGCSWIRVSAWHWDCSTRW